MRQRSRRPREGQAGFTLVELMISLVLFSFAIAGVLSVAVSMTQGYREQRLAIEAESAVRGPLDYIADALRQASVATSTATIYDAETCSSTAITVTDSTSAGDAIAGTDELDVIYASGAVVTSTRDVYDGSSTTLNVTDASELSGSDYVVITNLSMAIIVKVASKSSNALTLTSVGGCGPTFPAGGYPVGSLVIRARHARFFVGLQDTIPTLFMDPDAGGGAAAEPLAEGIEDMQIALGIDNDVARGSASDNGTLDSLGAADNDDDWVYNHSSAETLTSDSTHPIRAVRVTLIARSVSPLTGNATASARPAAEDHTVGSADAYRRRVLRTVVELRNMGGSP